MTEKNLTVDGVYNAAFNLKPIIRKTDLIQAENLGDNIYLKTENLQKTGSFKIRGAYNKLSKLKKEEKNKGLVTAAYANNALGLALSCKKLDIKITIFMPEQSPLFKVENIKSYGAEVVLVGNSYEESLDKAKSFCKENNEVFFDSSEDYDYILAYASLGLEILDQLVGVDIVVAPVGSGSLIGGLSFLIKSLKPDTKIIGVEAENAASMKKSIEAGKIQKLDKVSTFSDAIAIKKPNELAFDLCKKYVDEIVTVSEDEIASAILVLLEKQKLMCEGAGAVSFAAIMHEKIDIKNKKTVALLSGGNLDVNILSRIIKRGLEKSGRNTNLKIELTDKPGELVAVSKIIADSGANVIGVEYNTLEKPNEFFSCVLNIKCETRNKKHENEIKNTLKNKGFILQEN